MKELFYVRNTQNSNAKEVRCIARYLVASYNNYTVLIANIARYPMSGWKGGHDSYETAPYFDDEFSVYV